MTRKMATPTWMAVLGIALLTAPVSAEEGPGLKTLKEKVSYGLGVDIGRSYTRQGIEVDVIW